MMIGHGLSGKNNTKVFCISYPRTGTKSIAEAFRCLGYRSWHFNKKYCGWVLKVIKGEAFNNQVFEEYDTFADIPIFLIYKKLDKLYPGSKFILITRNKSSWFKSMNKMLGWARKDHPYYKKINDIVWGDFCPETIEEHTKEVKQYFSNRNNLLIEDLSKINYKALSSFLNIKTNETGFPHEG